MNDSAGIVGVFCCRSDENNFGNLSLNFGVENQNRSLCRRNSPKKEKLGTVTSQILKV